MFPAHILLIFLFNVQVASNTTTLPTTTTPKVEFQSVEIIDKYGVPVPLNYYDSKVRITCSCSKDEKVDLMFSDSSIQSEKCDGMWQIFEIPMNETTKFGQYKCQPEIRTKDFDPVQISYYFCDDKSSQCQQGQVCPSSSDMYYCVHSETDQPGVHCTDPETFSQKCEESQKYHSGCGNTSTVTSAPNTSAMSFCTRQEGYRHWPLCNTQLDDNSFLRIPDIYRSYHGRHIKMAEPSFTFSISCGGKSNFTTRCVIYDESSKEQLWPNSTEDDCIGEGGDNVVNKNITLDQETIFRNRTFSIASLRCTSVSSDETDNKPRMSAFELVYIGPTFRLNATKTGCSDNVGVKINCRFNPGPPVNSLFTIERMFLYAEFHNQSIQNSTNATGNVDFVIRHSNHYICKSTVRYRTCSPFQELFFNLETKQADEVVINANDACLPQPAPPAGLQEGGKEKAASGLLAVIVCGCLLIVILAFIIVGVFLSAHRPKEAKVQRKESPPESPNSESQASEASEAQVSPKSKPSKPKQAKGKKLKKSKSPLSNEPMSPSSSRSSPSQAEKSTPEEIKSTHRYLFLSKQPTLQETPKPKPKAKKPKVLQPQKAAKPKRSDQHYVTMAR